MDEAWARKRFEAGERGSETDTLRWLRQALESAGKQADVDAALIRAGVLAVSLLDRVDQTGTDAETLVSELRADGRRAESVNELLRRLVDRDAPDRLWTVASALAVLDPVEQDVRAAEAAQESAAERPAKTSPAPAARPASARRAAKAAADPAVEARNRKLGLAGCGTLVLAVVGMLVYRIYSEESERSSPSFEESVAGTSVEYWDADRLAREHVAWATVGKDATTRGDLLEFVTYRPDVFPRYEPNDFRSWRANYEDRGLETLSLGWSSPERAIAVVVVESFKPGAITAVDDILTSHTSTIGAGRFARLWSGTLPAVESSRATVFRLREPRRMGAVRIVLDTAKVPGQNCIDAVGLVLVD